LEPLPSDSRARQIASYSFLVAFTDGVLSRTELEMMECLALKDHIVDADEKRVLGDIFRRLRLDQLAPDTRTEIDAFCARHGIALDGEGA